MCSLVAFWLAFGRFWFAARCHDVRTMRAHNSESQLHLGATPYGAELHATRSCGHATMQAHSLIHATRRWSRSRELKPKPKLKLAHLSSRGSLIRARHTFLWLATCQHFISTTTPPWAPFDKSIMPSATFECCSWDTVVVPLFVSAT